MTVRRAIEADLYKQKQEKRKLYNPYRNLYLDKCYGEGKRRYHRRTHVLVNDPTLGYGIFIENMLQAAG